MREDNSEASVTECSTAARGSDELACWKDVKTEGIDVSLVNTAICEVFVDPVDSWSLEFGPKIVERQADISVSEHLFPLSV